MTYAEECVDVKVGNGDFSVFIVLLRRLMKAGIFLLSVLAGDGDVRLCGDVTVAARDAVGDNARLGCSSPAVMVRLPDEVECWERAEDGPITLSAEDLPPLIASAAVPVIDRLGSVRLRRGLLVDPLIVRSLDLLRLGTRAFSVGERSLWLNITSGGGRACDWNLLGVPFLIDSPSGKPS